MVVIKEGSLLQLAHEQVVLGDGIKTGKNMIWMAQTQAGSVSKKNLCLSPCGPVRFER
jgi:hypothetical protein